MCVCVCVSIYVCIHVYVCVYICACMYICVCECVYKCACVCIYARVWESVCACMYVCIFMYICVNAYVCIHACACECICRVFANGPADHGSILGRVIPKTQNMVLDAALHNTHDKIRIKGKVEQSREEVTPSPKPWCCSYCKESLWVSLD